MLTNVGPLLNEHALNGATHINSLKQKNDILSRSIITPNNSTHVKESSKNTNQPKINGPDPLAQKSSSEKESLVLSPIAEDNPEHVDSMDSIMAQFPSNALCGQSVQATSE